MKKRLYLDLNHWISLAKARVAGDLSQETQLAKLVEEGKVIVPVSAIHLMEVAAILKDKQRSNLAAMLRSLSKGIVLRPLDTVQYLEMESRLGRHYGCDVPADIRLYVTATGYYKALGELEIDFQPWRDQDPEKSAVAEAQVWQQLNDKELLDRMLSLYFPKIPKEGAEVEVLRAGVDRTRTATSGIPIEKAEADCVMGLGPSVAQLAVKVVTDLKLSAEALAANPPRHFWTKEYLATIPTVNVWAKLNLYLARAMSRDITANDLYDLGHMAVAVPYCDYVVADSAMAHLLTFRRLNEVYGTKVYSSISDCLVELN